MRAGPAVLTKDDYVPPTPTAPRPSLAVRAALVASTAAAALAAALPVAPEPPVAPPVAPAPTAPAPVVTAPVVTAPVVPVASTTGAAPAARRSSALQNALGKVGSPYRHGAAGPNAFDCSGLVNWAYRSAGTSLPRTSRDMSRVGTPVSRSDLQPGDLVFFYKPVSHVAIYVGNGKVVHASTKKSPVKVSNMGLMPFTSARRV